MLSANDVVGYKEQQLIIIVILSGMIRVFSFFVA